MWPWNLKLLREDFSQKYILDQPPVWKPMFPILWDHRSKILFWEQYLWWSALLLWPLPWAEPTVRCHDQACTRTPTVCPMAAKCDPKGREKASWPCAAPQALGTWSPLFLVSFSSGWQTSCPHLRAECCSEWFGYSVAVSCSVPGSWPVAPADCEV